MKMRWNNFDGYDSDDSVARNLLVFITATLHSLPVVPSLESLSHSPDSRILFGPARGLLVSKGFASFSKNYSVNYCIDVCDIPQFRALYSYNNGTIWGFVIASSLFLLFESEGMDLSLNCLLESCFDRFADLSIRSCESGFRSNRFVPRKSTWRSHMPAVIRISPQAFVSSFQPSYTFRWRIISFFY